MGYIPSYDSGIPRRGAIDMMHHIYLTKNKSLTTKPTENTKEQSCYPFVAFVGFVVKSSVWCRVIPRTADLAGLLGTRRFAHPTYRINART